MIKEFAAVVYNKGINIDDSYLLAISSRGKIATCSTCIIQTMNTNVHLPYIKELPAFKK